MKILVSAYACDPYRGSEPGVGWAAVCRIARKHDVYVITDDHNRAGWEKAFAEGLVTPNVKVQFLRKDKPCSRNRFVAHVQSWLSYADFNRKILKAAQDTHRKVGFDLCHQVTIAAWRMPSPLWKLGIPFIWGPVGGAGHIPASFRPMLSGSARLFEMARDINTWYSSRSRAFRNCIRNSAVVFAANEETENFLLGYRQGLRLIRLPIASISTEKFERFHRPSGSFAQPGPLRLFAGGNIEGRKGVSLALRALSIVAKNGVDFHYTVAGGGPEIGSLKILCHNLGLDKHVEFHKGYQGEEYINALKSSDVYFLPSFRESTPVTLLEAYLAGCYPVVADTSAQGEIVRLAGGHAVRADSMDGLIEGLASAVIWCHQNRNVLAAEAAKSADIVAKYFSSERYDQVLDDAYAMATGAYCQ